MTQFVKAVKQVYVAPARKNTDTLPKLDMAQVPKTTLMQTFARAVTARRDHGSATEARFVAWLCNRLPVTMIDPSGNVHVDLRTQPEHRSMFTAHTDTVHSGGGLNEVRIDGNIWRAGRDHALGADDAAGVAILCHMIESRVPGYYLFCRGEEHGGEGSRWLAENMRGLFKEIDRAIAFDRADYYDVITHQAYGRCCSDAFAEALATQLSTDTSWYMPCSTGVYTDTAEFVELVPECTNISVGYKNQHGDREQQDTAFLIELAGIVVNVKWDELPVQRDPKFIESTYSGATYWDSIKNTEDELADAIDDAMTNNDTTWLMDLIAESFYPSNPDIALRLLMPSRLTVKVLENAFDQLDKGLPADYVLEMLSNECYSA